MNNPTRKQMEIINLSCQAIFDAPPTYTPEEFDRHIEAWAEKNVLAEDRDEFFTQVNLSSARRCGLI